MYKKNLAEMFWNSFKTIFFRDAVENETRDKYIFMHAFSCGFNVAVKLIEGEENETDEEKAEAYFLAKKQIRVAYEEARDSYK